MVYTRYNNLMCDMADDVALASAREIEKLGITAVPLPGDGPYDYWDAEKQKGKGIVSGPFRHRTLTRITGAKSFFFYC